MKIMYLANAGSIHTKRWARHFSRRGHDVTVVSFQAGEIEDIRVLQLPSVYSRRAGIVFNFLQVCRLVRQMNPDVLHAHYVTSYGLAGAFTCKHPFVITAWGSDVLVTPEESWVYRQMVRFALRRADLITSMADHMTQLLIRRRYARASRIVTLPFGVDTEVFNLDQRTRTHGEGSPVVISTRRLDYGLDVDVFIQSIPRVLQFYPNARFVVVGDGPLRTELVQLAVDLKIADQIEFRGEILHEEMAEVLSRADVFVSTSRSDGNNVSLNEAMACGAFPIATDIPANRTWIEQGQNGLLFSCQDADGLGRAIVEALNKPDWRQMAMAKNWEIIYKRASWTASMAQMEDHYAALAS